MTSRPREEDADSAHDDDKRVDERDGEAVEAHESVGTRETASWQQVRGPVVVTLVVVLALVAGALLGRWSTSSSETSTPGTTSVDGGEPDERDQADDGDARSAGRQAGIVTS